MSNAPKMSHCSAAWRRINPHRVRILPAPDRRKSAYAHWLGLESSMTRELAWRFGAMPDVVPTFEGAGRLALWESALLGTPARRGYVREVRLKVREMPVLAARTVSGFANPAVDVLRRLSNRSLAEVLFHDARWQRVPPTGPLLDPESQRVGRACI